MNVTLYENYEFIMKSLFDKSKRKKGFIYLLEYWDGMYTRYVDGSMEPRKLYKYGKTTNLQLRMRMYGEEYKLLKVWKVDHLALRELLIHSDYEIEEERQSLQKDGKDEHVEFDCFKIVEYYATAKLNLEYQFSNYTIKISNEIENPHYWTMTGVDADSWLLDTMRVK